MTNFEEYKKYNEEYNKAFNDFVKATVNVISVSIKKENPDFITYLDDNFEDYDEAIDFLAAARDKELKLKKEVKQNDRPI